jgi:hypothetical protein
MKQRFVYWKIIVNLQTQNNSKKQKVMASLYLSVKREASKQVIAKTINKMMKKEPRENYRLVAFKDMSNEDVFITKSTADTRETITVDGVEYQL